MTDRISETPAHSQDAPLPWVSRWLAAVATPVRLLDFAAGSGRHARLAAQRGYAVTAADRDADALARIGAGIETVCTDLEEAPWPFEAATFGVVIVANFLHRPRLDEIAGLLSPGGWLIYQTFAHGNAEFGKPSRPDFLLQPGELLTLASRTGLTVAGYEFGLQGNPATAVVQCLAARRPLAGQTGPQPPSLP